MQIIDAQIHVWGSGLPGNDAHIQVTSFTPEEACNKLKTSIESKRTQGLGLREFYGTFRDDDRTAIIRFFD